VNVLEREVGHAELVVQRLTFMSALSTSMSWLIPCIAARGHSTRHTRHAKTANDSQMSVPPGKRCNAHLRRGTE
jgi:hypothetical protein